MRLYGGARGGDPYAGRNPTRIAVGTTTVVALTGSTTVNSAAYVPPVGRSAVAYCCNGWAQVTAALAAGQTLSVEGRIIRSGGGVPRMAFRRTAAAAPLGTVVSFENIQAFLTAQDELDIVGSLSAGAGTADLAGGIDVLEYDA